MDSKEELIEKLKKYTKDDIVFTSHAFIRAKQRNIKLSEVIENITNPKRLVFARKQKANKPGEEKYDCYFVHSNTLCHRYVLIINKRIIVCTIIKINRRWQKRVEKHGRI